MNLGVAYHPPFADCDRSRFELRFDQRHQLRERLGERERRRQHCGETDKTGIAGDDIGHLADLVGG